ncbi:hypothetical protein M2325_000852 [Methanococcus voltae PS]|uniref:Uncharacterized protein n=1 Tax=Methanococcus voltae PS TaxID=523842 RepID=A0ABT2EW46_METVO|nr:hypothetical protein [Methanococcus voltae]MCS3922167.1 hypothetical protein [Methanococcus voltae PS]
MISKEDFELLKDYTIFYKLLDDISYYTLINNMYEADDYIRVKEINNYLVKNKMRRGMAKPLLDYEFLNRDTEKAIIGEKVYYKLSDFGKMVFEEYKKDKGYR